MVKLLVLIDYILFDVKLKLLMRLNNEFSDFESDLETEDMDDLQDSDEWNKFDMAIRELTLPCGYRVVDGSMVNRHDVTMNEKRNPCKLMLCPLAFQTEDNDGSGTKSSKNVSR